MKIAYLTPEYPHLKCTHSAGVGTSIYNLSRGLLGLGCEVRVLVYGQDQDKVFQDEGVTIQKIKNKKVKGFSRWLTQKKIEKLINQLYKSNEIDLVESIDWGGITSYIQPKKCPIIIKLHGSDTYFCRLEGRRLKKKNFFHEMRALSKADAHLAVSDFVAKKTNEFFNFQLEFLTVYNGVDLSKFKLGHHREVADQVLYVGTLIRKKGVLDLAHIFNKLIELNPEVKLDLVGSDAPDKKTKSASTWKLMQDIFTKEALQKVTYYGKVPYDEVKSHLEKASVCVFPSHAEAFPVSWLEAMAMQKAILASSIGWANEVIEDGREGYLKHPEDHQAFAQQINDVLQNRTLMKHLGENAYNKVTTCFSHQVIAQKHVSIYNKVIRTK